MMVGWATIEPPTIEPPICELYVKPDTISYNFYYGIGKHVKVIGSYHYFSSNVRLPEVAL